MIRMISGTEDWAYIYTADDERLWSYHPLRNTSRWTLRDLGGKVLREYLSDNGRWSVGTDYIYRDGSLLAAETQTGRRHFHLDHLGTPGLITRGSGYRAAYHVYYPFGEELTAFNQDTERMKFTGHERDLGSPAGAGDDLDYMHARHHSPVTGRFLSVDPKVRRKVTISPQRWNRYNYAMGNPLKLVDPDGKDVIYANDKDRQFYESAAKRNYRVRAVLDAFAPGTGKNLRVSRGDPGQHPGAKMALAAVTKSTLSMATPTELQAAHAAAGGGETGDKAAQALLDKGMQLREAEIILGPKADSKDKLHEIGHVDQALRDPEGFAKDAAVANSAQTEDEYEESNSEQYADRFAVEATKNDPEPP